MNKVTKDLMKWFPTIDCNQAFDLHMKLMMEGVDFSEISNKELKSEAARLLGAA
jgi:hypothetical protein